PDHTTEISKMKLWIQNRMNWLNERLNNYSACANPVIPPLVISKINYHPKAEDFSDDDDLEFLEITNKGNQTVNLTGYYFSELGISYQFPANSIIGAGKKIILAGKESTFQQFYGTIPFGQFTRNLSNKSEKIVLADAFGNVIDSVRYLDSLPWPVEADGGGYFLQLTDLNADNSVAENWTISSNLSVGTINNNFETVVNIYPNPAQSIINIESKQLQINSFEIFDISGRKLKVRTEIRLNHFSVDVSELLPAVYLIKIYSSNGEYFVRKFSKIN
ncbi:MAG TPA: lamin tail domain-containing protein, partial [Draconibacterium sp.]|nr:lamin tail domain-containing protein [Draconibacterium sp.]